VTVEVSDAMNSQHIAHLTLIRSSLGEAGFDSHLIEADDELPVSTLVVGLGADDLERARSMTISIMPFGDDQFAATQFIQFYAPMPYRAPRGRLGDLGHAMAVINGAMALGHFAVRGDELFFRYMLSLSSAGTIDPDMLLELMSMLVFHQEHFSDYLEGVLDGEISLLVLADVIAQSQPGG